MPSMGLSTVSEGSIIDAFMKGWIHCGWDGSGKHTVGFEVDAVAEK